MWTEAGERYVMERLKNQVVALQMSEYALVQLISLAERSGLLSWASVLDKMGKGVLPCPISEFPEEDGQCEH